MIKKQNKNLKSWPMFISFFICILSLCLIFNISPCHAKKPITVGKGIWINIWNYPNNPDMFCEQLKSKGINTIYLQVSRSNMPAIKDPIKLNQIIKSAHEREIKVIGWTYSFLKDPLSDAEKFIKAAFYKTPSGDSLDGMAADLEEVTNSRSIETFARVIRKAVGIDYPLIAITFSPVLKRADPKHYAWKTIANNFDIIAPMTYWHGFVKLRSEKGAYDYTTKTITKIKEFTQKDDIKIHLIGDGQKTSSKEITGFLKAAEEHGIDAGVSLYPWYKPKKHQIETLGKYEF
ncbi:MAG: hypothetical protein HY094_03285 [Candidatus Melainabacteria bacterium]|nr:hypothetical protein [Candidatus Melainabacteria bacterium]